MKTLKWVLGGLVVLVVAVAVTGYVLLSSFDVEQYRGEIQAQVKQATGRDLLLDGPMDLRISLTPAITVERVGFGNADWGSRPQMATIERFEIEVALLPLLSDEIQVKRLVLVRPDILVETDAEGRSNLAFGPAAAEQDGAEAARALAISVDEISIEEGRLVYRDGVTGSEMLVELDSLTASTASLGDPIELAMAGRYNDLDFKVDGSFGSFRELNMGPFPLDLTAEAAGATVKLEGEIAQPMSGQGVDLTIFAKGDQISDLSGLAGTAVPALGAYELTAKLTQDGMVYRLSDIAATLGESAVTGVAAVEIGGEAPRVAQLDLRFETRGDSLSDLNNLLGQELPDLGPYEVSFRLIPLGEEVTGTAFRLDELSASLGESDLAGFLTIDLGGARPKLAGELTSRKLDIAALAPGGSGAAGGDGGGNGGGGGDSAADGGGYLIPDVPLPLETLRLADAQVSLKAGEVILPNNLTVTSFEALAVLQDGDLNIDPLVGVVSSGELGGGVQLDSGDGAPSLRFTMSAKGVDYGRLLEDQGVDKTVAGKLDFEIDVTGAGDSPRAIASTLDGGASVSGQDGVISNRLLKIVAVGLGDVLGPLFGDDEDARLNCMLATFRIEDGVATAAPLVVDSEVFTVSGAGTVDLRDESLDLAFDTATRETSIASLAVPFNVTGTLKNPRVAPDPLGTALGIAKTAGMVINPVAGLGVLIGERVVSSDSEGNACVAAVAEASGESGGGIVEGAGQAVGGAAEGAAKGAEDAVEGVVEGVGEGLKSLFGN